MNRFNHSHPILLIFCFPLLLLQCCKPKNDCPAVQTYTYDLTADQKSKLPYYGSDTLVFVSNSNDTVTCIGKGKQDIYDVSDLSGPPPDCEQNKRKDEKIEIEFVSDKTQLLDGLKIGLYKEFKDDPFPESDRLALWCNSKFVAVEFKFFNDVYYTDTIYTTSSEKQNVLKLTRDNTNIFYYNHTKGIVAIKNDRFWRLLK